MSAPAFTPGPWIAPPFSSVVGLGVVGGRGTMICTIATPPGSNPNTAETKHEIAAWDEIRANARLIAAAPEMYEAASAVVACADEFKASATVGTLIGATKSAADLRAESNAAFSRLRAALAKARGES